MDIDGRQLVRIDHLIWLIFCLEGCCLIIIVNGCCMIVGGIIRIVRRIIVHLISHLLLDVLEYLPIHKLREWI